MTERTPEWLADAIVEALHRGRDRYGRREIVLALLNGSADMETIECDDHRYGWAEKCGTGGKGKCSVLCETSGGSFYRETRTCEGCNGTGEVRRLKMVKEKT